MPYINTTSHKKFIEQCCALIFGDLLVGQEIIKYEKNEQLKEDVNKLQSLVDAYKETLSKLPHITREYNALQNRIKADIRKRTGKRIIKSNSGKVYTD